MYLYTDFKLLHDAGYDCAGHQGLHSAEFRLNPVMKKQQNRKEDYDSGGRCPCLTRILTPRTRYYHDNKAILCSVVVGTRTEAIACLKTSEHNDLSGII